jgi:FkbM family methyltransferase
VARDGARVHRQIWLQRSFLMDTRTRAVIDRLQRQLDEIEKTRPMTNNYARIDPFVVRRDDGGREFDFIIYHTESQLWYGGAAREDSLNHLAELLKPDDRIFDVGCNSGLYTVWMGMAVPQGKVVSFDPFPWNAAATMANAELNGLSNVTVHGVGLGSKDRTIHVHANTASIYEREHGGIALNIVRPDRYIAEVRPTFIKLDVEGAERELAKTNFLGNSVRSAYVEMHPHLMGNEPSSFLDYAHRRNFSIRKDVPRGKPMLPPFNVEPVSYYLERREPAGGLLNSVRGWFSGRQPAGAGT